MPLVKEAGTIYGPNYNDRQANTQQGDDKWPQYFLPSKQGRGRTPLPLCWGALFSLPSSLHQQRRIISSCNSCSHGGRRGTETHSCPPAITAHPCRASLDPSPWVQPWDRLPQPLPKPQSLRAVQDNLQIFFFHGSTVSVWKIKDRATPHILCLVYSFHLAKPWCDARNTHSLQSIFCILSITRTYVSPRAAHQLREMVSAHAALNLYPQLANRDDAFGKFSCH